MDRFGSIFFDSPQLLSRGYICSGEGHVGRLGKHGTAALDSRTTWLTNLDYNDIFAAGLQDNFRFRMDSYLREKIGRICLDCGKADAEEQTETASMIFNRVMKTCAMLLGRPDFSPGLTLKSGFREYLGSASDDIVSSQHAARLREAVRFTTTCITNSREGASLRLRVPPRRHCIDVLSSAIPVGDMKRIPKAQIPPAAADNAVKQRWFAQATDGGTKPGLFRIACRNFRPEFERFINFGDGGFKPERAICDERQWVTSTELVTLLVFSDVCIHEAFVAEKSRVLNRAKKFAESLPEWTIMSMTMDIIYDNLWTGMTARRVGTFIRTRAGSELVNAAAPFLRAQDLQLLFEKAWGISQSGRGLSVRGYSSGTIRIAEKDADPGDVWNACIENKLLPPFLHIPREELPDPFHECGNLNEFFETAQARPDLALKTVQILRATDSFDMLAALDMFVLEKLKAERIAVKAAAADEEGAES